MSWRYLCLFLLSFPLQAITAHATPLDAPTSRSCKCQPSQACWPTPHEWQQLNSSVGGQLIHVRPIAAACYGGTAEYDAARCAEVEQKYTDGSWRSDQAGAVEYATWEPDAASNETCWLPSLLSMPPRVCKQGSIPLYAVSARTPSHISQAVKFAATHNIPLAIKNSGHDFLGRSTRRNSLMIWTHHMKSIEFLNDGGGWVPAGCKSSYKESVMLVRIGAGVQLYDLYKAVGAQGRTVVAGFANGVGAAGGFIQGGGHSPLGPWKGMGSDHLVEAEVVTADGNILKVSPCSNPDLFWAIRGGGGGTFGVVTSATLRTHENPPVVMHNLTVAVPFALFDNSTSADEFYWEVVNKWYTLLPAMSDNLGGSAYYYIVTNIPAAGGLHYFTSLSFFIGSDYNNGEDIKAFFEPVKSWASARLSWTNDSLVSSTAYVLPQTSLIFNILNGTDLGQGGTIILGSRLLSKEILSTPSGVKRVSNAMRDLSKFGGPANVISGHLVAGGAVASNGKKVDSAVNPVWRKAISHIIISAGWNPGASFEEQEKVKKLMTRDMVPKLKQLDWDDVTKRQTMGAYLNEADKEEVNWWDSFWGVNYKRLLKLKKRYDPQGVFWCRPCVGSEEWDKEGVCKIQN